MNKIRRKELQSILDQLEVLKDSLETLMSEEEEYCDIMPENLQGSVRYEAVEVACDAFKKPLMLLMKQFPTLNLL